MPSLVGRQGMENVRAENMESSEEPLNRVSNLSISHFNLTTYIYIYIESNFKQMEIAQ